MAAVAGNTDSNLSGKPSDDIDKQKGPASGSNAESAGSTLHAATKPVEGQQNQESNKPAGSTGSDGHSAQQQKATGGSS